MNKVQTGFELGMIHILICWVTSAFTSNLGIIIPVIVVSAISLGYFLCNWVEKKCN